MIIYSQDLIEFLKAVKAGSVDAAVADRSLIDEAKNLACITVQDGLIRLTERGEVVRRMTYYYPRETYISLEGVKFFFILSFIGWLCIVFLALNKEMSTGWALFWHLVILIPMSIIWIFIGYEKPRRRVQIIGPSDPA